MEKNALRHELKLRLVQMSRDDRIAKSKQICGWIVDSDIFKQASVVMVYLSMPHEVDTTSLILTAWQQGKTVAVPKVSWEQRHMIPVEITSLETGLKTDERGLRTPTNGIPVAFDEIDLVITPGLGFDNNGNRLGRGGAYYDNFFKHNEISAARWAVAYNEQMCNEIPHDENDISMNAVVSEDGIKFCNED
jgi:5-formyltetrahydrofolate cyclo-ligase